MKRWTKRDLRIPISNQAPRYPRGLFAPCSNEAGHSPRGKWRRQVPIVRKAAPAQIFLGNCTAAHSSLHFEYLEFSFERNVWSQIPADGWLTSSYFRYRPGVHTVDMEMDLNWLWSESIIQSICYQGMNIFHQPLWKWRYTMTPEIVDSI